VTESNSINYYIGIEASHFGRDIGHVALLHEYLRGNITCYAISVVDETIAY